MKGDSTIRDNGDRTVIVIVNLTSVELIDTLDYSFDITLAQRFVMDYNKDL